VAVDVIHLLEAVEVDEQDGQRHRAPASARERLLQPILEQLPVRKPGERVVQGAVSERLGVLAEPVEVDEDGQLRPQDGRVERLDEIVDRARGVRLEAALGGVLARDEDDRHVARLLAPPDDCGGLEAIHARQADVQQDRRDVRLVQEVAERLLAGCHRRQGRRQRFDDSADRFQRGGAVVNG
jgi:hypothetical protein